jgi:hypothetical protein
MVAYTFRMPAGIPGECTRFNVIGTTIRAEKQNATTPITQYGVLCVVDQNGARPVLVTDSAMPPQVNLGISIRPYVSSDLGVGYPMGVVGFGGGTPPATGIIDIMYRGYASVKLNGATAATRNSPAYVWFAASAAPHVQGGWEAASNASAFAVPSAAYAGAADAGGTTELAFNI